MESDSTKHEHDARAAAKAEREAVKAQRAAEKLEKEEQRKRHAKEATRRQREADLSYQPALESPRPAWTSPPTQPTAVIAAPLYNKADYLPETLDSLLSQSYENFALLLVDDCSTDATSAIAQSYAVRDARVSYRRNATRLGMIANKRHCLALARELFPSAPYFAWGSDHDIWRSGWLGALVEAMSRSPEAVCAYPKSVRIDETGTMIRRPWEFDTAGVTDIEDRLSVSCDRLASGFMVYGLYRSDALARVGAMHRVIEPDRLLLLELSLHGQFVQVPGILWERRFAGLSNPARQRASLFAKRAPLHTWLSPWLQHAVAFFWFYAVRGAGKPEFGRLRGLRLTWEFLRSTRRTRKRRRLDKQAHEEKVASRPGNVEAGR